MYNDNTVYLSVRQIYHRSLFPVYIDHYSHGELLARIDKHDASCTQWKTNFAKKDTQYRYTGQL